MFKLDLFKISQNISKCADSFKFYEVKLLLLSSAVAFTNFKSHWHNISP